MTDTEIIELFYSRSELAITQLAYKHGSAVGRVALNILGDLRDAEECVNDTWLGVWNSIPPNRPSPLRTYVCKIARNLATKKFHANTAKKRNSSYDAALSELEGCIPDPNTLEAQFAAKELGQAINAFLANLDYKDRFMFMRRYWYGDPIGDIARMVGMSYNVLSVRLSRIRNALKKFLISEGLML